MLFIPMILAAAMPGLPKTGVTPEDFVPKTWEIEVRVEGALSAPDAQDVVLVLLEDEHAEADRRRALVVLKAEKEGFSVLGSNVGLIACFGCQGPRGDGEPAVTIENRVLIVNQVGGGAASTSTTHRFRLEKGGLKLIGRDTGCERCTDRYHFLRSENLVGLEVVEELAVKEDDKPTRTKKRLPAAPLQALEDLTRAP
jgi:hypothetical protein